MIKKTLTLAGLLFIVLVVLALRPVPIVAEEDAMIEKGIVSAIYGGGVNDVVFQLEHTKRKFYINRGLENGLELNDLKNKLIGQEVVFKYPKYWTPLDWNNDIKHLSKLEFKNEVLFNELH